MKKNPMAIGTKNISSIAVARSSLLQRQDICVYRQLVRALVNGGQHIGSVRVPDVFVFGRSGVNTIPI